MKKPYIKHKTPKILLPLIIILLIFLSFPIFSPIGSVSSEINFSQEEQQVIDQLQEGVLGQLDSLNLTQIQDVLDSLDEQTKEIFGSNSFKEKLLAIVSGQFSDGKQSFWEILVSLFFDDIALALPIMASVIAIAISGGLLQGLKPATNSKSMQDIIHFVTYGIIVVIVLGLTLQMVSMTGNVINSIKSQMDAIFPLLLTLLTALGGSASISVYQPSMALLTGTILNLFTYILLPLFIFSTIFSIISNLSSTVKLDKFSSFFSSAFKWICGLIFTVFSAFLSIQGITAGAVDGISIKTAKFAIRSYVPILGSYLSDGLGIVLASSSLIKNAIGATGLLLLVAEILAPLVKLIVFMLALKLIAAIIEPLGNSKTANFISGISKSFVLLISIIIGISFIYFIMLGLIICSANVL